MSLALRLGRTLEELGRTMTSAEYSLWEEFHVEQPWDGEWIQTGLICSSIANYAGKTRSDKAPPAAATDYMPPWKKAADDVIEDPDPEEHFKQFM